MQNQRAIQLYVEMEKMNERNKMERILMYDAAFQKLKNNGKRG